MAGVRQHFDELDALRGCAAATVLLSHLLYSVPAYERLADDGTWASGVWRLAYNTPLHALWAGSEAVVLFFVLSGFVLSLPYIEGRAQRYRIFLVRRVLRLYPAYLVAAAVAVVLAVAPGRHGGPSFLGDVAAGPIDPGLLLQHASMVAWHDLTALNPVVWSLIHEMRVSILFPAVVWLVLRCSPVTAVAAGLAASLGGHYLWVFVGDPQMVGQTLKYLVAFVLGVVLAKHRSRLVALCSARPAVWAVVAVSLYSAEWWLAPGAVRADVEYLLYLMTLAGCCGIVLLALTPSPARQLLLTRPCQFLGRISYSLYLVHLLVIVVAVEGLSDAVPLGVRLVAAVPLSIGAAWIGYRFVERPAILWGRRFREPVAVQEPVRARASVV